jgi:hypothetical protein
MQQNANLEGVSQQGCNLMFHNSMVKIREKEKKVWKGHENDEDQKGEISLTSAIKCVEFV